MAYESVDALQKALATKVFRHTADAKKAAGRSLGTLVEIVTFYTLREWGLSPYTTIEYKLPEYGNPTITHNVEFAIHPAASPPITVNCGPPKPPLGLKRLLKLRPELAKSLSRLSATSNQIISVRDSHIVLNNSCLLGKSADHRRILIAQLSSFTDDSLHIQVSQLHSSPFAIVECKRVGIEEGARKGPTTIEKAKQGAYVAKHASCLQKVRAADGTVFGVLPKPGGGFDLIPYVEAIEYMLSSAPPAERRHFVLTVGVVSNHGNWFTSDNPNKELRVLAQSYDYLLFLGDDGLAEFITDLILNPAGGEAIKKAFLETYDRPRGETRQNLFTKVRLDLGAHLQLTQYFRNHIDRIERDWFTVLSPKKGSLTKLKNQLRTLLGKEWTE